MDGEKFGLAVVEEVRGYMERTIGPILARIEALEARQLIPGPQGIPGADGLHGPKGDKGDTGERGIEGFPGDQGERGYPGERGEQGLQGIPGERGEKGMDGLPGEQGLQGERGEQGLQGERGEKGIDGLNGEQGLQGERGEQGLQGERGEKGIDGKNADSITLEQIKEALQEMNIEEIILNYLAANPPIDGKNGIDGIDGRNGEDGKDGPQGKDGLGLAGGLIDRDGNLVMTLTDGSIRSVGVVVGRDGVNGERGEQGLQGLPGERGEQGLQGLPGERGDKGLDGKDGRDAFELVQLTFETDGDRNIIVSRKCSGDEEPKKSILSFPIPIDRGVYKTETSYQKGDTVSWGGSLWIAQVDTSDKPETSKDWRLSVKRGRDGKDGTPGERGPEGKPGKDGGLR
jgi:hypothetical protein